MEQTTQGTQPPAEQPGNGIQGIVEQSNNTQVTPSAQPGVAATNNAPAQTPPEYTPEQVAQWREQAQQANQLQEQYRNLQSDYTRKAQALAQLAGSQFQQPQQDPYEQYAKWAEQKGFDKDTARAVAEMADMIAQQRTQSAMQQFQYQNAGNQIPIVMQQAYSNAPQALQNPAVQEEVRKELMELAQAGQFQLLTPDYAANRAKIIAFDKGVFVPGAQQPPAQQPNPNISSIWGIPNGFNQSQKQEVQRPASPITQQVQADLAARYKGAKIQ